jgi:hypothetical protein
VGEIGIGNSDRRQNCCPRAARGLRRASFLNGLSFRGDLEERDLNASLIGVTVEPPRNKAIAVCVNEIPWYVLSQCDTRRSGECKLHCAHAPEWNLRSAEDRADLQAISRQKPFRRQDAKCVHVIVALSLTASATVGALESFDRRVTTVEQDSAV